MFGATPWWIWEMEYEYYVAKMLGMMEDEWIPEWCRAAPKHFVDYKRQRYD